MLRLISESVNRILNENLGNSLQKLINQDAMEQLSYYGDLDIISPECVNSVMSNGYYRGSDLTFSYENGNLTVESASGYCELHTVRCDLNNPQQVIQAMAECINNGVMVY